MHVIPRKVLCSRWLVIKQAQPAVWQGKTNFLFRQGVWADRDLPEAGPFLTSWAKLISVIRLLQHRNKNSGFEDVLNSSLFVLLSVLIYLLAHVGWK